MPSQRPERHFGLLQYHISQQATVSQPAVGASVTAEERLLQTRNNPHTPLPDLNPTLFIPSTTPPGQTRLLAPLRPQEIVAEEAPGGSPVAVLTNQAASEDTSEQAPSEPDLSAAKEAAKPHIKLRVIAIALVLILALTIYFIWHSTPTNTQTPVITPSASNTTENTETNSATDTTAGNIQVYVVGAVQHPGVYTLPANARIFQLLEAAGGPLPEANLVAINLAAKLHDGQEVYVTRLGEKPPTYVGGVPAPGTGSPEAEQDQLVNINTATVDEMRQQLHVSSKTAQSIVDYREQHGDFTAVEELLQVVSQSIYDKIKGMVTV